MVKSFRDLTVWQKSRDLAISVYRLTASLPHEELYGISAQMRRCAASIPSNIAEGHGRLTRRDYRQFLSVARGSNCELQTQLEIASALGLGNPQRIQDAMRLSEEVGKMIYAIATKLAASQAAEANPPLRT